MWCHPRRPDAEPAGRPVEQHELQLNMDRDRQDLDEEFPLGDGTADDSATIVCPYCSEAVTIAVDPGSGSSQRYVEDCEVCCKPWNVNVRYVDGSATVDVSPLDE